MSKGKSVTRAGKPQPEMRIVIKHRPDPLARKRLIGVLIDILDPHDRSDVQPSEPAAADAAPTEYGAPAEHAAAIAGVTMATAESPRKGKS